MVETILGILDDGYEQATVYNYLVFVPDDAENFNNKKRRWFQESAGIKFELQQSPNAIAKAIAGKKVTIKVKNRKDDQDRDSNEIVGVHSFGWQPESANAPAGDDIPETLDLDNDPEGW